jgi:hypothetical protein
LAGSIGEDAVYVDKGVETRILEKWWEKTRIKPEFSSENANLIGKHGQPFSGNCYAIGRLVVGPVAQVRSNEFGAFVNRPILMCLRFSQ